MRTSVRHTFELKTTTLMCTLLLKVFNQCQNCKVLTTEIQTDNVFLVAGSLGYLILMTSPLFTTHTHHSMNFERNTQA